MTPPLLLSVLLLGAGVANACTYDEADQLQKLRALARSIEGSQFDVPRRQVRWTETDGGELTVEYGGCEHLGFRITYADPDGLAPSEAELVRIGLRLAGIPEWIDEDLVLARALESGSYDRVDSGRGLRYEVRGTDYAEMYLESVPVDGAWRVTFGWVRNF